MLRRPPPASAMPADSRPTAPDPSAPDEVPVFPLNTVLFPGGPLPLRIFEPRYVDMVSECLRRDAPFAVSLIRDGEEAGRAAHPYDVGTLARIVDWNQQPDGLLGIVARGEGRVRLRATRVTESELVVATVERLAREPAQGVPGHLSILVDLAKSLVEHADTLYANVPTALEDASWVGYRLAEILPLPLAHKQRFLEMEDALARLEQLAVVVRTIAEQKD